MERRRPRLEGVVTLTTGSRLPASRLFWAVVTDEIDQAMDFFPTGGQAERMVAEALRDEPDWRGILRLEKVEFRTGTAN